MANAALASGAAPNDSATTACSDGTLCAKRVACARICLNLNHFSIASSVLSPSRKPVFASALNRLFTLGASNNGSGALNPADGSYLNEFRMSEGVDTSYTKFGRNPQIDDSPYNKVAPPADLLYVGWTEPGEWFNITVDVAEAGNYSAELLYTSNRGGGISFDVNGQPASAVVTLATTYDAADPVAWRQWHHWNVARGIATLHLAAGRNVLTVHIVTNGQMNFATLDFKRVK